jgi:small subunit ribosomal protein S20
MPNVKSAEKRVQVSAIRRARNVSAKSAIKTYMRKYQSAVAAGETETAITLFRKVTSLIDRAAGKGSIHKNTAARRKSRLAAKL